MALQGKVLIALAVSLLALIHTAETRCHTDVRALGRGVGAPQCGRQAGNRKCRDNLCCSEFGFCGDTEDYCGDGCQSQCSSGIVHALGRGVGAPQCGRQAGNRKCRDNLCCSEFGFCGDTEDYCGDGCQSQCSSGIVHALGRGVGAPQCGKQAGNRKCRDNLCCSEFGFCGDTEDYCGDGCQSQCSSGIVHALGRGVGAPQCGKQAGNRKCRDNLCCSEFGFCGDTEDYCGDGCQSQCSSGIVHALGRGVGAPQCGKQAGNRKCRDNLCCSEFGFCGDTEDYCGDGCQSQCSSGIVHALGRGVGAPQCGKQAGNRKCRDNLCCSEFGFCGDTEDYCGDGCQSQCSSGIVHALGRGVGAPQCGKQAGNRKCRDNLCCSEFGFCGDTEDYCGDGCQSQCSSGIVHALGRGVGAPQCGKQAGNRKCRDNLCCSEFGFCGDTEDYCGDGCQSQCSSGIVHALGRGVGAPQCGKQAGNRKCRDNLCCSEFGFCGDTEDYCGDGCQSQCSSGIVHALGRGVGAPQCGKQAGNRKCRDNLCCSEFGFCGDTEDYCGDGCQSQCSSGIVHALGRGVGAPQCGKQAGNRKCRDNLCCSEFGFCGDTEDYCGDGCQSQCSSGIVHALGRADAIPWAQKKLIAEVGHILE